MFLCLDLAQGDKTYSVNIHDDDGGSVKNETRIPHPFNHSTSLETPPDSPRPIVGMSGDYQWLKLNVSNDYKRVQLGFVCQVIIQC